MINVSGSTSGALSRAAALAEHWPLGAYTTTAAATGLIFLISLVVRAALPTAPVIMWFSPLVAVAALLAGWRSGLLATVLGLVATTALFTIGQPGEPNSPYVFALAGLLISIGGD